VLPTAAARQYPERAVANARVWFGGLGGSVEELPVLTRGDAQSPALAELAADGRLFYLVGGDPGHLLRVLDGSAVWRAIEQAWRGGAALAGSSAGAMVLGEHVLLRARWPNHQRRRAVAGLGVVPGVAIVPHYDGGGGRWTADAPVPLLGIEERTAAVWTEREGWRVLGAGRVTLVQPNSEPVPCPPASLRDYLPVLA
jgi:cyanophycinase